MNCQFCSQNMLYAKRACVFVCHNHDCLVCSTPIANWLGKDGYEIYFDDKIIELNKYDNKNASELFELYFQGYVYSPIFLHNTLISIDNIYDINPDNFDYYIDKLKKLVVFS